MRKDDLWIIRNGTIQPVVNLPVLLPAGDSLVFGDGSYGFRDNSGVLEYKNSGGSYAPIGSGGGGGSFWSRDTTATPNALLYPTTTADGIRVLGAYSRFGTATPLFQNVAQSAIDFWGTDNTNNGVQFNTGNTSNGVSAYNGYTLFNDAANSNLTNFAGIYLNSSGYSDTTFGTGVNTPNQFLLQNTLGPTSLVASAATGYINFLTGGAAAANERMRILANGNVGIGTTAPTHTLTLPSTSTGIALYNTADQTVNYERAREYWSGNTFSLTTEKGGTGTARNFTIQAAADLRVTSSVGGNVFIANDNGVAARIFVGSTFTTTGNIGTIEGTYTGTAGVQKPFAIIPTINQTSTAGYTALLVNPTETTVGSGAKLLADFQTGGVSRISINAMALTDLHSGTLVVNRPSSSANQQFIGFTNGIAYDSYFGRPLNSDDFAWGTWNGSSAQETMRLARAGNLGLGTTAPQQKITLAANNSYAIEVAVPAAPTLAGSTTGGSIAAGTYYYVLTASDGTGNTALGIESTSVTITGTTSSVTLTLPTLPNGGISYSIYRTTTSGTYTTPALIASGITTSTYVDILAAPTAGAPATVTTAYQVRINGGGNSWIENAYNFGIGTTQPQNLFHVNGTGGGIIRISSSNGSPNDETITFNTSFPSTANSGKTVAQLTGAPDSSSGGRLVIRTSDTAGTLNEVARFTAQGRLALGVTSPTAILHIKAGSATLNTAPLKFTSGTVLTTPEPGAVEFDGTHFYGTIGSTRYQLDQQTGGGGTYTGSSGITLSGSNFTNDLITGKAGGQTIYGGTGASENLTLASTTNATKGLIYFGAAQTAFFDAANQYFQINTNGAGVTQTLQSGTWYQNSTAATSILQQISPSIVWEGQGWKTTATAASQPVRFQAYVLPVLGTASPSGNWLLQASINGAAFGNVLTITSAGTLTAGSGVITAGVLSTNTLSTNSNLYVGSANGSISQTNAIYIYGGATTVYSRVLLAGGNAATILAVNSNYAGTLVSQGLITTAASGTHAWLSNAVVRSLGTVTTGASAVTNSATLYVDGASTVGTNNYSIYTPSGLNYFGGTVSHAGAVLDSTGSAGSAGQVLSSTSTATAWVAGGYARSINNISTASTGAAATNTDYVYFITGTTTFTLPTAVGNTGEYTLKNAGTNTVTIATTSSQTIFVSTALAGLTLAPGDGYRIISNGTNWVVVAST